MEPNRLVDQFPVGSEWRHPGEAPHMEKYTVTGHGVDVLGNHCVLFDSNVNPSFTQTELSQWLPKLVRITCTESFVQTHLWGHMATGWHESDGNTHHYRKCELCGTLEEYTK